MELLPKILIVDDELEHLEAIIEVFEDNNTNYNILQAMTGESAFKIAENEIPDLIITDWEMPDINGIKLLKLLKSKKNTSDIPVIMCTGVMTNSENLKTALEAGAVDYIRKPIDDIELIARTNSMLRLSKSHIKLKVQKKELADINKFKDKMFSIISHDLRGPVGNFKNVLDLIVDEPFQISQKLKDQMLKLLATSSKTTFELLENLLCWSQSQQGELKFNPDFHKLAKIVDEIINLMNPIAINKGIYLNSSIDERFLIYADLDFIKIIIRNIIGNAIKFTNSGGKVDISGTKDDQFTKIEVKDNGVGILKENVSKIFDQCEYVTTTGTGNETGSGLGLMLCKELTEKHGGTIQVESKIAEGTTITMKLPNKNNK